jgi:hypothetical protein
MDPTSPTGKESVMADDFAGAFDLRSSEVLHPHRTGAQPSSSNLGGWFLFAVVSLAMFVAMTALVAG